jgi:heat-inducible transcriptional repressor
MMMKSTELGPRMVEVLHSIVEDYIATGSPVASRTIARRRMDNLSPATIRNIMADLADAGFLDQPHTSAGRVPTLKAFQHFAQALVSRRLSTSDYGRVRGELMGIRGPEERVEHSSHLLVELTRNVGIAAAIPASSQLLDQVEFVLLSGMRVLMVVVTRDQMVRNQVVQLDEPVTQDELHSIRNYVNLNFAGWPLAGIRRELDRRLQRESAAYDQLLRKLTLLYEKGLLEVGLEPHVYLGGASNLVGLDLHLTKERLRELFRALEEKKRLIALLDAFLAHGGGEVRVKVGLEEAHPALRDFAMIGIMVETPGGMAARMAVLGPVRMNYGRVAAAVAQVGEALRSLPQ